MISSSWAIKRGYDTSCATDTCKSQLEIALRRNRTRSSPCRQEQQQQQEFMTDCPVSHPVSGHIEPEAECQINVVHRWLQQVHHVGANVFGSGIIDATREISHCISPEGVWCHKHHDARQACHDRLYSWAKNQMRLLSLKPSQYLHDRNKYGLFPNNAGMHTQGFCVCIHTRLCWQI